QDDDVAAEGRGAERQVAVELFHGSLTKGLGEAVDERPSEGVDRAGDHDLGEVEGADHGGEGDAEAACGLLDHVLSLAVGGRGGEAGFDAGGADPGLEAAALAARALLAQIRADDDVADLAGGPARAAHGLA